MGGRVGVVGVFALALAAACAAPEDDSEIVDRSTPASETDETPAGTLRSESIHVEGVIFSVRGDGATFAVTRAGVLWKVVRGEANKLLDHALGRPAVLASGDVVVARGTGEPGQSDLWLVPREGAARPLVVSPGPDESPIALPDGRIVFVSGRTTIASLFVFEPGSGRTRQLTNRGLVAGGARVGFVPPPLEVIEANDDQITYDAGDGEIWRVDLESGRARQLPGGSR